MKSADSPRKEDEAEQKTLRESRLDQMVSTLTKSYRDWEQEQKGEKQAQ